MVNFFTTSNLNAQNVGINSTGATPNTSAGLDVDFSNKGVLIPRVTLTNNTDVTTVPSPVVSLMVYHNGSVGLPTAGFYYWNGTLWVNFGAQGPAGATGATGPQGPAGPAGATGAAGQGVPTGGTAGQVLTKINGTDYNTQWTTPSSGGASTYYTESLAESSTTSTSNQTKATLTLPSAGTYIVAIGGQVKTSTNLKYVY